MTRSGWILPQVAAVTIWAGSVLAGEPCTGLNKEEYGTQKYAFSYESWYAQHPRSPRIAFVRCVENLHKSQPLYVEWGKLQDELPPRDSSYYRLLSTSKDYRICDVPLIYGAGRQRIATQLVFPHHLDCQRANLPSAIQPVQFDPKDGDDVIEIEARIHVKYKDPKTNEQAAFPVNLVFVSWVFAKEKRIQNQLYFSDATTIAIQTLATEKVPLQKFIVDAPEAQEISSFRAATWTKRGIPLYSEEKKQVYEKWTTAIADRKKAGVVGLTLKFLDSEKSVVAQLPIWAFSE